VAEAAAHNTTGAVGGIARLGQWFGIVLPGTTLWIGALALWFRIPLAVPLQVPERVAVIYVVGLYLLLMGAATWIWRLDSRRSAPRFSFLHLLEGLFTGLLGLAIVALIAVGLGWARVSAEMPQIPVLGMAALAAAGFAISEEALFRGFMLGLLRRDLTAAAAIWASAALFAFLHFLRPVDLATAAVPFAALLAAGALLAMCRLRTGTIWFGVGLHAAWICYFAVLGQQRLLAFEEAQRLYSGGGQDPGLLGIASLGATYLWVGWRFKACAPS
jgi:membrane protease YdiL (CAAX protease family)